MIITVEPTYKQHLAYQALKTKRFLFFGGGAGGGKSWWLCESRLMNALMFPGYKSFIGREELKRLMQSTYITFNKVCKYHGVPNHLWKLNGQYNYIDFKNGSRIDLLDLKYLPSDPLYERFGSLEYTDGAIEEAGEIHYLAYDVLKTRINRHMNEELGIKPTIAITGNPKKNWTYTEFYQPHSNNTLPKDTAFIQSLYNDNKHTAKTYGEQLDSIKDPVLKDRLKNGNWDYEDDPTSLIGYDSITGLFTNDHVKGGPKYIICDVARYGSDKAIITVWDGFRLIEVYKFDISSTVEIQNCINAMRSKHQINAINTIADDDGVGGGVVDNCKIIGFVNNSKAFKDTYYNLKSECGYKLAELIDSIYIGCDLSQQDKDNIIQELGQLKTFDSDKDNKLRITPKEKIKDNIGRSHDWLDIFIMRMYPEVKPPQRMMQY